MDAISSFFNNSFFRLAYDPVADSLRNFYRENLEKNVNTLLSYVTGPISTRYNELRNTPGVRQETLYKMEELINGTTETVKKGELSPDQLASKLSTVKTEFAALDAQARQEAADYLQEQKDSDNRAKQTAEEDKTFNIYRMMRRIREFVVKYILLIILACIALLGGSLMSNRAILKNRLFRLYYFLYGTVLFPLSYFVAIRDYTQYDRLPSFYAIFAPLMDRTKHRAVTNTLFFPFVYTPSIVPVPAVAVAAPAPGT